jgi:hypothetical protein
MASTITRIAASTMNMTPWGRKQIALVVAIVTFACAATYVSIALARPQPVASAVLSDQWQCTKTAGILTVCTKKRG